MKKIYYGIQDRNLIDNKLPVNVSKSNCPGAESPREKLMIRLSIGKETPASGNGEKSVNWLNLSFEIEKDNNGLFLGELDFSRNLIS